MLGYLFQIIVTVSVVGHTPVRATLPTLYANNSGACERKAEAIAMRGIKRKGTTITVECVSTHRRDT
jgi:hypothetical protein